MKNIEKEAARDAERWAAAEMAYGEGAGVRRRHLEAEIGSKVENFSGYHEAFQKVYDSLDMDKFAKAAIKERKALDRAAKASRNFRALRTGNIARLSNGVYIVAGAIYLAHVTGYDKKIEAKAKELYRKARVQIKYMQIKRNNSVSDLFEKNEGTA